MANAVGPQEISKLSHSEKFNKEKLGSFVCAPDHYFSTLDITQRRRSNIQAVYFLGWFPSTSTSLPFFLSGLNAFFHHVSVRRFLMRTRTCGWAGFWFLKRKLSDPRQLWCKLHHRCLIVRCVMRKQNVYERGRSFMSSCHRPFHYHSSLHGFPGSFCDWFCFIRS